MIANPTSIAPPPNIIFQRVGLEEPVKPTVKVIAVISADVIKAEAITLSSRPLLELISVTFLFSSVPLVYRKCFHVC